MHDESITEKLRQELLNYDAISLLDAGQFDKFVQDFAACFALQRLHLNQKEAPTALTIKEQWPCLFTELYADIHF